ncbi:MAG: hypothetical protein ACOY5Y_16865 [Pseudomonadota bacterium]
MTRDKLVALLSFGVDAEPELIEGGVRICHTPFVAPLAYLHRIYPPLSRGDIIDLKQSLAVPNLGGYGEFLAVVGNGARIFNLSLGGFVRQLNRSLHGLGQPISLDYGNVVERPSGLEDNALVIGGVTGWSSRGVFVQLASGEILLTHAKDGCDVAARWPSLDALLADEILRLSKLHDRMGRSLVGSTELMHPGGRRWETEPEPPPKPPAPCPPAPGARWRGLWRRWFRQGP